MPSTTTAPRPAPRRAPRPASHRAGPLLLTVLTSIALALGLAPAATAATPVTFTAITPTTGPAGATITLTGGGFTGLTAVAFNGTPAKTFTAVSASKLTAVVPATATTGPITVTTTGASATTKTAFTVTRTTPTAPTALATTTTGLAPGSVTVTWAPPTSTGGSAITGYTVGRDGVSTTGYGAWSGTKTATARSHTFTQLVPGSTYTFTVRAVTAKGTGLPATIKYTVPTPVTAPGAPTGLTLTTTGLAAGSVTLSWTAPASTGGSAITGYTVARDGTSTTGAGPWSGTKTATTRSVTFNQLVPGASYAFTVTATNAKGASKPATITYTQPRTSTIWALQNGTVIRTDGAKTSIAVGIASVSDIAVDGKGRLLAFGPSNMRVTRYDPTTKTYTTLAAGLEGVDQLEVDAAGNAYLSVQSGTNVRLLKIDGSTLAQSWIDGPNGYGYGVVQSDGLIILRSGGDDFGGGLWRFDPSAWSLTEVLDGYGGSLNNEIPVAADATAGVFTVQIPSGASGATSWGHVSTNGSGGSGYGSGDEEHGYDRKGSIYGVQQRTWCAGYNDEGQCVDDLAVDEMSVWGAGGSYRTIPVTGTEIQQFDGLLGDGWGSVYSVGAHGVQVLAPQGGALTTITTGSYSDPQITG